MPNKVVISYCSLPVASDIDLQMSEFCSKIFVIQKHVTLILNLPTFQNKNVTKMIAFQAKLALIISDADRVAQHVCKQLIHFMTLLTTL